MITGNISGPAPVRTLVVDDSPLMRKAIGEVLSESDRIEVVATATNGLECLNRIAEYKPDVITLDIDMPVMNGISAVKNIMVRYQIPTIIVSSLIQDGYFAFEALRLGVMDFFPKPTRIQEMQWLKEDELLRTRVITAAGMRVNCMQRVRVKRKKPGFMQNPVKAPKSAVVMGTTLAGPNTVMHLVTQMPPDFDGVIIAVQEIHPRVLIPFCSHFNEISPLEVVPVTAPRPLLPGKIYIGSTFRGLSVESGSRSGDELDICPVDDYDKPIDQLFRSASRHFQGDTCGVLLTGIGMDGAEGVSEIKSNGGLTIAQETSCCAFPDLVENALKSGALDLVLSTGGIVNHLKSWTLDKSRNSC